MIHTTAAKWARLVGAILLTGTLLYLAMRGVAFDEAWQVMRRMRWPYMGAAIVLTLISPFVRAWRWQELYDYDAPGFWLLFRAIVTGQTLNLAVPFRTGEVARVLIAGGRKLDAAGTVALEKLLDAGFFAALCLLLPFVWVIPNWLEKRRESVIVMAAAFAVVILSVFIVPRISRFPRILRMPPITRIPILAITTVFLGMSGVAVNDLVLRSLAIQTPFIAAVVLLVILQAGVAVPSTPGKLGVFQYLAVLGLSLFGVGRAPAIAFGLLLHLLVFLPPAAMAALFLGCGRAKPEDASQRQSTTLG
jgi:uncharacterized membrane protein YbhN (UPF0104 family)